MRESQTASRARSLLRAAVLACALFAAAVLLASSPTQTHGTSPVPPVTDIRAFLETCPANDPMYAQIRSDFEIRVEGVPVGAIACSEPVSAMPLAQYSDELIIVQALRAIYYMEGGRQVAYPWASGSMYDWLKSKIGGIDIQARSSYCCEIFGGKWYPVISSLNTYDREPAKYWTGISYRIGLIAHETRHVDGFPHVGGCPLFPTQAFGCDQTYDVANLSPYAVQYWLNSKWLSGELNAGYACLDSTTRTNYAEWHIQVANSELVGRFVTDAPPLLTMPAQPGGVCSGASPTVTPTPSPAPTATPTPSPTHTPSPTPSRTPTPSATATLAATATPTPSIGPTLTPTPTATPTPTPAQTGTPTPAPTPTPSTTPTLPPPPGPTLTPSPTATAAPSETPGGTETPPPEPTLPAQANVNCDAATDAGDVLVMLEAAGDASAGTPGSCPRPGQHIAGGVAGDVNCDGAFDLSDVLALLRALSGFPLDACTS